MKKVGWERRYVDYLRENIGRTFDPGTADCGLEVGNALEIITGTNPGDRWRGKYKTLAGAYRVLRRAGFDDHVAYIASLYEELPSPLFAQRGDIAVVNGEDNHPCLGIVQGENIYVLRPTGYGIVRLTEAVKAFRT